MFAFRARSGFRPEAEDRHSVALWPASCARSSLQGFVAGYAGAPELPALRTYG
jgi:hypothetical protein